VAALCHPALVILNIKIVDFGQKKIEMLRIAKMQLWHPNQQVVDARAGPGMKSLTKFKTKNRKNETKTGSKKVKPHFDRSVCAPNPSTVDAKPTQTGFREYSPGLSDKSDGPEDVDIADMDCLSEDGPR